MLLFPEICFTRCKCGSHRILYFKADRYTYDKRETENKLKEKKVACICYRGNFGGILLACIVLVFVHYINHGSHSQDMSEQ